jgi:hypothetical protein
MTHNFDPSSPHPFAAQRFCTGPQPRFRPGAFCLLDAECMCMELSLSRNDWVPDEPRPVGEHLGTSWSPSSISQWHAVGLRPCANVSEAHDARSADERVAGVRAVRDVRARWVGHRVYSDVAIEVDPKLSVSEADVLARQVEKSLSQHVRLLGEVVVRICPVSREPAEPKTE